MLTSGRSPPSLVLLCFPFPGQYITITGCLYSQLVNAAMKVLSSLKSAKQRHRDCKIVRRRGKVFVICKSNPRFKARQR